MAFSLAALPAYALARRAGTSTRAALLVAGVSLAIPAGVFSGMVMAEPYAYPAFLLAVLLAAGALETPTPVRLGTAVVAGAALILLGGLQFAYFLPAVIATWLVTARSARLRLAAGATAAGAALLAAAVILVAGDTPPVSNVVSLLHQLHQPVGPLAAWLGIDAFLIAVAAGWVVVPGAILGLVALGRSARRGERILGTMGLILIVACLFEAADWSTKYDRAYERLAFYAVPLLLIGFARWLEREGPTRAFSTLAYACAGTAILVPLASQMHIDGLYAPPLTGLAFGSPASTAVVWAPLLGLLAAGTGLVGQRRRGAVAAAAGCVAVGAGLVESLAVISFARDLPAPALGVRQPTAYVTTAAEDPFAEMRVLFWNPSATRVLLVGGGISPDGFPSTAVGLSARGALRELDAGRDADGPFIVGPDTLGLGRGRPAFASPVRLLAFGWYPGEGSIAPFVRLYGAGGPHGLSAEIRLWSTTGAKTVVSSCTRPQTTTAVRVRPVSLPLVVAPRRLEMCVLRLTRGTIGVVHRHEVAVHASIEFTRAGASR